MKKTEDSLSRIVLNKLVDELRDAVLEEDNLETVDEVIEKIQDEYDDYNLIMRNMKRENVYEALDSERDYQDERWSSERHATNKGSLNRTVDEFALYIQNYANELGKVASSTDNDREKLEIIRKIGALCVACGEAHSLPTRSGEDFEKLNEV